MQAQPEGGPPLREGKGPCPNLYPNMGPRAQPGAWELEDKSLAPKPPLHVTLNKCSL